MDTSTIHGQRNYLQEKWSKVVGVVNPITLATTGIIQNLGDPYIYTRNDNQNRDETERMLASIEQAKYGLCFSSGMGSVTTALHLLVSGDHIICTDQVYSGTNTWMTKYAPRMGLEVTFVDCLDHDSIKKAITDKTKMVWLETPSNPLMKVLDIKAICSIVRNNAEKCIVVVDNTFNTSFFQKPLQLGADLVVQSITKYMNGHSDVLMGSLTTNSDELHKQLRNFQFDLGIVPSPFDCYLVSRSLRTLSLRMNKHMENGLAVARFLETHRNVIGVNHPGLESHPQHEIAKSQCSGYSGMLSFFVRGSLQETERFCKALKLFLPAVSLGGIESLFDHSATMTRSRSSDEEKKKLGITDNLIRLSVGLEDADSLIADLDQALNRCTSAE